MVVVLAGVRTTAGPGDGVRVIWDPVSELQLELLALREAIWGGEGSAGGWGGSLVSCVAAAAVAATGGVLLLLGKRIFLVGAFSFNEFSL